MREDPNELLWTEAQWEALMKRSDARSSRYGELLETLIDDPGRDAKIDREMGWDRDKNDEEDEAGFDASNMFDMSEETLGEAEDEQRESKDALQKVDSYRCAPSAKCIAFSSPTSISATTRATNDTA
jgi:hypothetical protein